MRLALGISQGDALTFIKRPISGTIIGLTVLMSFSPLIKSLVKKARAKKKAEENA